MIPNETIGQTSFQSWLAGSAEVPTILLVDDDSSVRAILYQLLEEGGYQVLAAGNGIDALDICKQRRKSITLLLTDVNMPGMSGFELARRAALLQPMMKVLFMSADAEDGSLCSNGVEGVPMFLAKPFSRTALIRSVRLAVGC